MPRGLGGALISALPFKIFALQSSFFLFLGGTNEIFDVHLVGRDLPRSAKLPPPKRELWTVNHSIIPISHSRLGKLL